MQNFLSFRSAPKAHESLLSACSGTEHVATAASAVSYDGDRQYLQKKISIMVPWFCALFGFCLYSYGLWQVHPGTNHGGLGYCCFFVSIGTCLYGIYGILRWSFSGF